MINISTIDEIIKQNNSIKLKIFALEYMIEFKDNKYIIYAALYQNRKSEYNSLKELFENYMIYNEPIIQSMDRIKIIK